MGTLRKKDNNGFMNEAARKFKNVEKADLLSQKDVFNILETDMQTILNQMTASRNHKGSYPQYVANIFGNLSASLYFSNYVDAHVKVKKNKIKTDLTDDDIESLKEIIADSYKKSAINFYATQSQEFVDRNKILSKAFIMLDAKNYKLAKKFKLDDNQTRDLVIQVYGNPISNMKFVKRSIDTSTISPKKKMKLLKKLYRHERFVMAVGAALTVVSNNSDCIEMLYNYMMHKKLKKRAPFVRAYAEAFKKNKSRNFRINEDFIYENRKLIRELKHVDIGYKKAFHIDISHKNVVNKSKKPKDTKPRTYLDDVNKHSFKSNKT